MARGSAASTPGRCWKAGPGTIPSVGLAPAVCPREPASRARPLSPDESLHAWKDRPAALRPQLQGSERLPITLNTVLYGLPHQAIV